MFTSKADQDLNCLACNLNCFGAKDVTALKNRRTTLYLSESARQATSTTWLPLLAWLGSRGIEEHWNQ